MNKKDIKTMTIKELCNELCENIEENKSMFQMAKDGLKSEDEFEKIFNKNCNRNEYISRELASRPDSEFLLNKYIDKINCCLIKRNEKEAKKLVNILTLQCPTLKDEILSRETKDILAGKPVDSLKELQSIK